LGCIFQVEFSNWKISTGISEVGQAGRECFKRHWTTGLFPLLINNTGKSAEPYIKYSYAIEDY